MKKWFFFLIVCSCLSQSCEKNIRFQLKSGQPLPVVEATIENGKYPNVVLTQSLNYFSKISADLLETAFIHNAEIYISNGTATMKLKEYTEPVIGNLKLYYYSADSADPSRFQGELNHQYSLRVIINGTQYTAATTIPRITKVINALFWQQAPLKDSGKVALMVNETDPPGYGDYVRYFTKTNSGPFLAPYNSVFDDLFVDGTTYSLQVPPGVDRNQKRNDSANYFRRGDTVTFKLCNIDRGTYDFWRTMEYSYASVGNPFSTPTQVLSNISGSALGYFGGYACQYRTVVIPK